MRYIIFILTLFLSNLLPGEEPKMETVSHAGSIMTVTGPISPSEMGLVLPHEHLLVDFIGANETGPHRYDAEDAYAVILPYLEKAKEMGVTTLVECTPSYIGKDPELLRKLSSASEVQLLTNTGYYAAAGEKFIPEHAYEMTAGELADLWLKDWKNGIGETGIKPGFIKVGIDGAPVAEMGRKVVRAAAIVHRKTGLTIACHSPDGNAIVEAEKILAEEGVAPDALIWVHANAHADKELHRSMAEKGMWVEFDGLSPDSLQQHLEFVKSMKEAGVLNRVLLSHDAGWYSPVEEGGGDFRFFGDLMTHFIPLLREEGFTEKEIDLLRKKNPATAFTIKIREL